MEIIGNISTTESPITSPTSALQNAGGTPSILTDLLASIPIAGTIGRLFIASDSGAIFRDTGTSWFPLAGSAGALNGTANQIVVSSGAISLATDPTVPGTSGLILPSGTTAQRPASPIAGTIRYNTTNGAPEVAATAYNIMTRFNGITRQVIDEVRGKWKDDFLSGFPSTASFTTLAGTLGELGWSAVNSTTAAWAAGTSLSAHPGILTINTSATNASTSNLFLGQTVTSGIILPSNVEYFSFNINIPTVTTLTTRLGLGQAISTSSMGTAGVFFQFNPAVSPNIQFVVRNGSVSTVTTTSTVMVANTWYMLEAFNNGSGWTPVINGTIGQLVNTNQPSAALNIGINLTVNAASARSIRLDYFSMYTVDLTQRF